MLSFGKMIKDLCGQLLMIEKQIVVRLFLFLHVIDGGSIAWCINCTLLENSDTTVEPIECLQLINMQEMWYNLSKTNKNHAFIKPFSAQWYNLSVANKNCFS